MSDALNSTEPRWTTANLRSRSSDVVFSLKLFVYIAGVYCGVKFAYAPWPALQWVGMCLLGAFFAHGVELQHQVLHNQGVSNKGVNEAIGVVLGLPMLVSFAGYQASHLRHHKHLGTPENKEFFDYGDQYGTSARANVLIWLRRLMMPSLYVSFICNLARALTIGRYPDETPDVSRRMRRDYLTMLLFVTVLAAASWYRADALIFKVWLAPLVLFAVPIHALIELPEHFACNTDEKNVFENTRSIKSNAFMTWFTNGNNYHVEHHLMPGLPIDRLHDLHISIRGEIKHYHSTYKEFFAALVTNRLKHISSRSDGK